MVLWNKPSYHTRLFLWLLGYSMILVGGFLAYQTYRETDIRAKGLNTLLQQINTKILNEYAQNNDLSLTDFSKFHPFSELRVSLISNDGVVIYDNTLGSTPTGNHSAREEIIDAKKFGSGYSIRRHSESTGTTYFYSATAGDNGIIVRSAVPYSEKLLSFLHADYGFLWIMVALATIMCIFGYFVTRRMGQHISRLNNFAENVEKGIRISDTEPFPHDELGDISNHIVRLYAQLQQAINDRDREHRNAMREQREKERIKKQLTNNINHELKTPIASVSICMETLLEHPNLPEGLRKEFLERGLANANRLRSLLADVSTLTRITDGGYAIEKKSLDLSEIIIDIVKDFSLIAESKDIKIENKINNTPLPVLGNAGLLSSVFQNLISNAISYSGGSLVSIDLQSDSDSEFIITVADNGCGIADVHLPRIFERFYRVDKGRSRAAGGTGLGLSIVKNVMRLHGGDIIASNKNEGGLIFTLRFIKS